MTSVGREFNNIQLSSEVSSKKLAIGGKIRYMLEILGKLNTFHRCLDSLRYFWENDSINYEINYEMTNSFHFVCFKISYVMRLMIYHSKNQEPGLVFKCLSLKWQFKCYSYSINFPSLKLMNNKLMYIFCLQIFLYAWF